MSQDRPLDWNAVVIGKGAAVPPKAILRGAANTVLTQTVVNDEPAFTKVDLTTMVTGVLPPANGGGGGTGSTLPSSVQGDLFYAAATDTVTTLAKSTSATRYLTNTGTSNNPAWGQVNLANGVTGTLPAASGGTGLNTSASTGVAQVTAGVWSVSAIDLATADVTGVVPAANGGTGLNTSASTGVAQVSAGTWSVSAIDLATADVTGLLPAANGGTGTNSSASTGLAHVTTGAWTYAPVNLASIEVTGLLPAVRGGTGLDTSASTGVAQITAGVWSVSAIDLATADVTGLVPAAKGGTGTNSSASTGIAHVATGAWTYAAVNLASSDVTGLVPAANGGTALDTSASTGVAQVTAGTWSVSAIDLASSDVTGVLPIANGGTGSSEGVNLTSAMWDESEWDDSTWGSVVFGVLPIAFGGTGSSTGVDLASDVVTGLLPPAHGGTGLDTSASTGVAQITAGTWSVSAIDLASSDVTGVLPPANGGAGAGGSFPSSVQGDLFYASAANTISALAKNTSATRYLANTGTSNNPAWAQINVANGLTGVVPLANGGTGTSTTFTEGSVLFAGAAGVYAQDNANFFWDDTNNTLTVANADASTTAPGTALALRRTTSAAMADGFAVQQDFILRDSAAVDNVNARILVVRDGADDTAAFALQTAIGGVLETRLLINSSGQMYYVAPSVGGAFSLLANGTSRPGLRFFTDSNANGVWLRAPATATGDHVWTLPSTPGAAGTVLSNDGAGILSWAAPLSVFGAFYGTAVAAGTTVFLGRDDDATEQNVVIRSPIAGSLERMDSQASLAAGTGETFVYTLRVASVDTAITHTVTGTGGGGRVGSSTGAVAIAAGGAISIKLVTSAAAAAAHHAVTLAIRATG